MVTIRVEQAVYGSFPFWDRGYALLAQSQGCSRESLDAFRAACAKYGERPHAVAPAAGLFAQRIPGREWMIVGVGESGPDDRGRPGALSFHAYFVTPRDYRRAGASPFGFEPFLKRAWEPRTQPLPAATLTLKPFGREQADDEILATDSDPAALAQAIAGALRCRRRVALEARAPIDGLARSVWRGLPLWIRGRRSVATWAYGNDNRFDLVALPRLAESMVDESYVEPGSLMRPGGWPTPAERLGRAGLRLLGGAWRAMLGLGRLVAGMVRSR
jgi:hypothetical protein